MVGRDSSTSSASALSPATAPSHIVCEIWPLDSIPELIESYRLRYEVYGSLGYIQRAIDCKLEIDEYDTSSVPYGAFDPTTGMMVGTLRLVMPAPVPAYDALVRHLLEQLGDRELTRQVLGPRPHPLPSIVSNGIGRQIAAFNTDNFAVLELSRTIVRPGHRGLGVSRGLMEFGIAHATQRAPAVLTGGCMPEHLSMYARYGYIQLPQSGLDYFDNVGQTAHSVVCRTDVMPEPARTHIGELLHAMRSGAGERALAIGRESSALYRFAAPRRARRVTIEW
jgi:GNAT superfamily N-acetyltransferase